MAYRGRALYTGDSDGNFSTFEEDTYSPNEGMNAGYEMNSNTLNMCSNNFELDYDSTSGFIDVNDNKKFNHKKRRNSNTNKPNTGDEEEVSTVEIKSERNEISDIGSDEEEETKPKGKKKSRKKKEDKRKDKNTDADDSKKTGSKKSTKKNVEENDEQEPEEFKKESPEATKYEDPKPSEETKGVTVYQIEVRFISFNGLRFCGGVRVIMNCKEERAYLQLITLVNEVLVSYDINHLYFLEPRSAAGVNFCGVPIQEECKEEEDADESKNQSDASAATSHSDSKPKKDADKKKRPLEKKEVTKIDHAEVVFYTPEQMCRFRTVMDTLLCIVSDDIQETNQNIMDTSNKSESDAQGPTQHEKMLMQNFEENCFEGEFPEGLQPVEEERPLSFCGMVSQASTGHACYGKASSSFPTFDPCPRGPMDNRSICLPCDLGDPYQYSSDEERVVFCTPACLRIGSKTPNQKQIFKGKLKILQGSGGIGFVIRIENAEGTVLYAHGLRRDIVLYPSSDVQFGFCYCTVVCSAGRTSMETFTLSFPSNYQRSQFKHAIDTCKNILGMTSVQCLINHVGK